MYQNGQGLEQDDKQAMFWYHKAAEQNDIYQFDLGEMYYHGYDNYRHRTEQDYKQAAFWFHKAAEQDEDGCYYANASEYLGSMYVNGHGVEQDDEQAVFWYRKAAEQGYAMRNLFRQHVC